MKHLQKTSTNSGLNNLELNHISFLLPLLNLLNTEGYKKATKPKRGSIDSPMTEI